MSNKKYYIFWPGVILIGIIFYCIRAPMLTIENSLKGWNSDYAIFVMMGEDILTGKGFPFFYWGGNYLGPLNSFLMGLTQRVMELFGYQQAIPFIPGTSFTIGPLAASINCLWMFFVGTLFYGLAFIRLFSVWETLLACLIISIGGESFVRFSLRPLAPEVAYLLAGLITWRGIATIQSPSKTNKVIFGFLFGFSWWMNQMTIFALAPIFYYFISQNQYYKTLRTQFHFKDRILLKMKSLGLSPLAKPLKYFLSFAYSLIAINFLMGVYIAAAGGINERLFGVKLKIHNGFSPMKTSLLIFLGIQFIIWFFKDRDSKTIMRNIFIKLKFFFIGFFLGYGPVLLGKLLGLYKKGYKPSFKFVPLMHLPAYWRDLVLDFFPRLLVSKEAVYLLPLLSILLVTALFTIKRHYPTIKNYFLAMPVKPPIHSILWGTLLFNLFYVLFCERVRDNYMARTAFRYALLSLPILAIYVTTIFRRIPNMNVGIITTLLAFVPFTLGQYSQGQAQLKKMMAATDHRDQLERIMQSECEIFFNDYWETYLYEYLLQHQKRFAVKDGQRGQDRTREHTKLLNQSPKKKCLDYKVMPL